MARTVPGSGAVIEPLFNKVFGIKAVKVIEGGTEYESADPPRLTITGCGTPTEEALLYPIIDDESGKIIHVRVLEPGLGYDPLRVSITPLQDTPNVVTSFDINRIWQSNPNSSTTGSFATDTDRLTIQTDGDPKPSNITTTNLRIPGGGSTLTDDTFNQQFIYIGCKEVPNPALREFQRDKSVGVMANGVLLHTPEWGALGGAPTNFDIDTVKHTHLKSSDEFDGVIDTQQYYYQSSKLINQLAQDNGAFQNGFIRPFTWKVKTETDNIMLNVISTEENNGGTPIEVGRTLSVINGDGVAEVAKVVRDGSGVCIRVYLRLVGGTFNRLDRVIGSNGFYFTISADPTTFTTGIFYIEFGPDAAEFGNFTPGEYYFAPEDIKVQRNYLIIWDQSDASNQAPMSHPMRFSTTADGTHNAGAVYYNSTGASGAPAADYENEYQALFIMNADETSRIYYYCAYHTYMSGYTGDEGYITFDSEVDDDPLPNNYYITDFYGGASPDYSRHANGHSKILGMSFDGYPIYGPYGYILGGTSIITTTPTLSYYGGLFFQVGNGYPTVAQSGTGSGAVVNITEIGTYQTGGILSFTIAEGGSGYAVGDVIRILQKYDGAFVSAYTDNSWNTTGSRTPGVYGEVGTASEFTVQASWTSANGIGGKPKVTVDADGSVSNVTLGGNGPEAIPGPDGNMGYNYIDDEVITIPGNYIGGSTPADDILVKAAWVTDDDSAVATITSVGVGVGKMTSSFRLKTGVEVDGNRPAQTTTGSVTHTITTSNGKFLIDGQLLEVLNLDRGKTYTFNLDDSSNDNYIGLFSNTEDGWHSTGQSTDIGDTSYVFSDAVKYFIDGAEVVYQSYISGFNGATTRSIQYESRVDAPTVIYAFSYSGTEVGYRLVNNGYVMGDFTQDYIYEEGLGLLDEQNGIFASTPEYPNGTYCYFMTEDSSGNPVYPYVVGPKLYGAPIFEGDTLPTTSTEFPFGAEGKVNINDGAIDFIKMVKTGDGYFGPTQATILGGEGSGATVTPTVQTITGLTLLTDGRNFLTPPSLIFEGGGGQGATGAASIDVTGKITNISVVDPGEFYDEAPYLLITGGGGLGAKAVARISQGSVIGIDIVDPGRGYTTEPNVIFQKLVDLKRKARARQSQASESFFLTGLLKAVTASDDTLYVKSTGAFPGSGSIIVDQETISYASKSEQKFTGLTRGVNFRYDQRVVLDTSQNDGNQVSTYTYNVGDRVIRSIENSNNKIAKVYDWNPYNRELLVTFEVDELAFIDAGIPSTEDTIVQFDAGTPGSASSSFQPHVLVNSVGDDIVALTVPISTLSDKKFEDDDEQDGLGDGIPDLVNTGTAYINQINLDGGLHSSLYGVEETQGGQNTTLFQVGESLKDGSTPLKFASVIEAGALNEGRPHGAIVEIFVDPLYGNGLNFSVNEVVTGQYSQIQATVVSWDNARSVLTVKDIVPYDTGDVSVGTNGKLYSFSENGTVTDFIVLDPGADYTQIPTIAVEDIGDVEATGTVNMTTAGDQIASVTITNGGYGIVPYVDGTYNLHPTITVTNGGGDTTGAGAILQAVTSGENIVGNGGASYKIKSINYQTQIRS